jgi:peptidyl-prolyl cis-trans isomerase B (cyclophilin B)
VRAPAPKAYLKLPKPTVKLDPAKRYELDVQTTCGDFTIQLDVKTSPKTSASLYYLAQKGFFDNLTFHRVAAGFVIQGGDPAGNGSGGPGYTVVEPPPASARFPRGTIAMAKTQAEPPGASGSQFFVVTGEDATGALQGQYAIGGHVVGGGDEVVQRIGSLPTNPPQDGQPIDPVVILRVIARQS